MGNLSWVIQHWIQSSISKEIVLQIIYTDDPTVIQAELKEQFRKSNATYIYQLSNDAALITQGSDLVSHFYTKLKSLWREFEVYGEVSHCDCLSVYATTIIELMRGKID